MAPAGENGSGEVRLERISRRFIPVQSGGIQSGSPYGPVAFTTAPIRIAGFFEPPADRLPQLSYTTGGGRPQQAAYSSFTSAERRPRSQDHLYSRSEAKSQGTRGEHHQGNANGVISEMTIGLCIYYELKLCWRFCLSHFVHKYLMCYSRVH